VPSNLTHITEYSRTQTSWSYLTEHFAQNYLYLSTFLPNSADDVHVHLDSVPVPFPSSPFRILSSLFSHTAKRFAIPRLCVVFLTSDGHDHHGRIEQNYGGRRTVAGSMRDMVAGWKSYPSSSTRCSSFWISCFVLESRSELYTNMS
jgi:hypothetical protein